MSKQKLQRWSESAVSNKVSDLIAVLETVDPDARIIELDLDVGNMTWTSPHGLPYFVAELIEKTNREENS